MTTQTSKRGARVAGAGGARRPRGVSEASALGNNADSSSAGARRERRSIAWRMRRGLWEISSLQRVRACGRLSRSELGGPTLRVTGDGADRSAGLAGLVTCGSVWSCPVCARKIGARRAEDIRTVLAGVDGIGGGAGLITLTLRHRKHQRLSELWDGLRYAWSRVTSGRAYVEEVERFGLLGWCAVVEVTHGDHGWHPHLHVLLAFDSPVSDLMISELAGRWFARWQRALNRRDLEAVEDRGGLDARAVTMGTDCAGVATYLAKVAHEVTGSPTKQGRGGSRTPFQMLGNGLTSGLADDIERWWEWEQASHGRRQLTWSSGLRERFGLGVEATDEQVASEDIGSDDLIAIPNESWKQIRSKADELLDIAEIGGIVAATAWLDVRGLRWSPVTRRPPRRRGDVAPGSREVLINSTSHHDQPGAGALLRAQEGGRHTRCQSLWRYSPR